MLQIGKFIWTTRCIGLSVNLLFSRGDPGGSQLRFFAVAKANRQIGTCNLGI